jgi:formylglycine-generating enzyme required for sulfatase activity
VGSVQRVEDEDNDSWRKVFENWYTNESDSGSHNAASWALRQWGLKLPTIEPTPKPSSEKDWWRTPLNLTMVKIPAGSVRGTSPMAQRIEIKQSFWLSDREITIEQFKQFIGEAKVKPKDWQGPETFENRIDDTHPVQKVSWEEAVLYCNWLSVKHGLDKCYEIGPPGDPQDSIRAKSHKFNARLLRNDGFRLPTADEWEYACRAGTTTDFSTGDDNERLKKYAVFGQSKTNTCGSKLCNPWGLHDMHGNVWEWCWDADDSSRVDRGGSWDSYPKYCQSAFRLSHDPQWHMYDCGFRVAQGP